MSTIIVTMLLLLSLNLSADFVVNNGIVEYVEKKLVPISQQHAQACEHGNMSECVNLAVLYFTGASVEENHTKAVELFTKACKKKQSKACYHLGTIYKRGSKYRDGSVGIRKSIKKSKLFYAKGCMYGYAQSCDQYNLIKEKGGNADSGLDTRIYRYDTKAYGG